MRLAVCVLFCGVLEVLFWWVWLVIVFGVSFCLVILCFLPFGYVAAAGLRFLFAGGIDCWRSALIVDFGVWGVICSFLVLRVLWFC